MSNELSAQDLLPPEIGLTLLGFEKSEQGWLVRAEGRTRSECPSCRTQSTARHSRYWRQLQDLPVQGKRVALRLRLSRWRCRNRECEQAIFRERLGESSGSLGAADRSGGGSPAPGGPPHRRPRSRVSPEALWRWR